MVSEMVSEMVRTGVSSDPRPHTRFRGQNACYFRILKDLCLIRLWIRHGSSDPKCTFLWGRVRDNSSQKRCLQTADVERSTSVQERYPDCHMVTAPVLTFSQLTS